jgi:pilus assembly protein CpaE
VDLDLRSGDVALTLGLTPERTLVPGPVGGDVLAAMVTPYRPGLDCLLAPVSPGMAERLEADGVGSLFASLARAYDVVVVDAPAAFTGPVVAALDRSDHHVLVTTPIRPALQRLRRTLDVMDALGHRRDSRSVLINRTHGATGITTEEIERVLRAPVAGSIPWSPDVAPSINAGTPLTQSCPDHPVSVTVRRFAQSLLPAPALVPSPRAGAP